MARRRYSDWMPLALLGLGVTFHVFYVFSVITIYFQSPLVFGLSPFRGMTQEAPAKRLVLFVADGLRADKFFERQHETPFLRSKIETSAIWGVSHTRVPTESRPGHVALIAGFYEDVSAVTKGWKDNPVEFDSVFNRSRETWAWGSPDILPMFSSRTDHMTSHCYLAEYEDFGAGTADHLDTWVFDKVEDFFKNQVSKDAKLLERVNQDKIVFFLHLLGIDTIGHGKRPTSKEYIDNIRLVDKGIEKVVKLMETFYNNDGKTSYIFTADHGMADRGVHGDGDPTNTETPFVAWGAGISKPKFSQQYSSHLIENSRPTPENWKLNHLARFDITQADAAPLMSTLIGVAIPVNSVGVLPTQYLDSNSSFKSSALLDNAKTILKQYESKENKKKETSIFFVPFEPLVNYHKKIEHIEKLIETENQRIENQQIESKNDSKTNTNNTKKDNFDEAVRESENLISLALEGLRYYQVYDKRFLLSIIIAGYIGFMAFTLTIILKYYNRSGDDFDKMIQTSNKTVFNLTNTFCFTFSMALFMYLLIESSPWIYYCYAVFPLAFWTFCLNHVSLWKLAISDFFGQSKKAPSASKQNQSRTSDIVSIVGSFLIVHVVVFGFYYREIFSVCFFALCLWGLFVEKRLPLSLRLIWALLCIISSVFPIMPVDVGEMTWLLVSSAIVVSIISIWLSTQLKSLFNYGINKDTDQYEAIIRSTYSQQLKQERNQSKISWKNLVQIGTAVVSTLIVYSTESSLKSSNGLPVLNQFASWTILIISFVVLVISEQDYVNILLNVFLSLLAPMILLSINFEVAFFATFFLFCIVWIIVERYLYLMELESKPSNSDPTESHITTQHIRVAAIYILCCFFAFFGTGNLAGFSGFQISSAFRFQTVFDPFLMGAILILKILIPFILLCAVFGVLNRQLNMKDQVASFMVVSVLSDSMALDFLLMVKDYGSWLEIGLSISNFAMLNFFLIFQMLLAGLTHVLLRRVRDIGSEVVTHEKED